MFVCGNDRKWLETPFFRSKFLITSVEQIAELKAYCDTVYIDTDKGLDVDEANLDQNTSEDNQDPAYQLYLRGIRKLAELSRNHAKELTEIALDITASLLEGLAHYPDTLLTISTRNNQCHSADTRTIDSCLQTLALGKHIGLAQGQLLQLGLTTIRYNLKSSDINEPSATEEFQAMIDIVSAFNWLCRKRFAGVSLFGQQALQSMIENRSDAFDADLLSHFIDTLGLYPQNCIVELNTGELGLVFDLDSEAPKRPALRLLCNARKQLLSQAVELRLNSPLGARYRIVRTLAANDPIVSVLMLHEAQLIR